MSQDSAQIRYQLNIERITEAILNDIPLNPINNLQWPCIICNKNVLRSQKAIQCDTCHKWSHIKCENMSNETYDSLVSSDVEFDWHEL